MKTLEKNKTWSATTLPTIKRTMGCKWVCTIKYNFDGSNGRYNTRLVAKETTLTYGIKNSENIATIAKQSSERSANTP
jgi:hypothetical protein